MTDEVRKIKETRDQLNAVSPSFCTAKWLQVTMHLQNGHTHSCHHPQTHKIPLEEIKNNKYTLNPGKYVDIDTDLISEDEYEEQLSELTKSIKELSSKNQKLNSNILKIIDEI